MKDTESLVMTVEPMQSGRHIKYKTTLYYWNRKKESDSSEFTARGLQRLADELNVRLRVAGPDPLNDLNLARTKAEELPQAPPEEENAPGLTAGTAKGASSSQEQTQNAS